MCTALAIRAPSLYFGRTLDLDMTPGEELVIQPRRVTIPLRHAPAVSADYALMGIAHLADGRPLWYDAANEVGLCMAALHFPNDTAYVPFPVAGRLTLMTFELIPWILGRCAGVREAREELEGVILSSEAYSEALPSSPLHWLLADAQESLVIEQTADGLHLYEDPVHVMTNAPDFPSQLRELSRYAYLSPAQPTDTCVPGVPPQLYSRGMGTEGMPGGLSSGARFVRAAFTAAHARPQETPDAQVAQVFHVLDAVSQVDGCCRVEGDRYERTMYAVCYDVARRRCCYTTYDCRTIHSLEMAPDLADAGPLIRYPLCREPDIRRQGRA